MKRRNKPKRRPAHRFLPAAEILLAAVERAEVPMTVASELTGITYITLNKYLHKERNIKDEATAKRMIAAADILNELVDLGQLPINSDINMRLRRPVILGIVRDYIYK